MSLVLSRRSVAKDRHWTVGELRVRPVKGARIEIASASRALMFAFCGVLTSWALTCSQARASESMPPRLYEVITETMMPHLEENLRYATTRQNRCLGRQELSSAFPILSHTSLKGC